MLDEIADNLLDRGDNGPRGRDDGPGEIVERAVAAGATVDPDVLAKAIRLRMIGRLTGKRAAALDAYLAAHPGEGSRTWIDARGLDNRSGLGWLSGITPMAGVGAFGMLDAAEEIRGRPVDCMTLFQGGANRDSWDEFVDCYRPGHNFQIGEETRPVVRQGMIPILSIPGIIKGANYADAARGKYDDFHKQAAEAMAEAGDPPLWILRFSRESDDKDQPFGAENDGSRGFRDFKKFHAENLTRIWTDALGGSSKVVTTFCLTKRGFRGLELWDWGADIVDCDLYINSPPLTRDEDTRAYDAFLDPFYEHAVKRGVPLAFSEWGITVGGQNGRRENDCPAGIEWMYATFVRLAGEGRLVHENYYNPSGHGIVPPSIEAPLASDAYGRTWGDK